MQVELLDFAKEILGYYGLLAIVTIYFFYNLPRFFDSVSYLSSRKIKSLEEALKSSYLSEFDEKVIKDSLSEYYLKKATNLSIDKRTKIDCLDLYNKLSEKFTLLEIEKAFQIINVSVIDYDLSRLELEHKKLKSLNKKALRELIVVGSLIYVMSMQLWLFFYNSHYLEGISYKLFGFITMFSLAQTLLTVSVALIILDGLVKVLKKIKRVNTAIDVVVFLKSTTPPQA